MGEHKVSFNQNPNDQQQYMLAILDNIRALEYLNLLRCIESSIRRIGVEQEMFLIGAQYATCQHNPRYCLL